MVPSAVLGNIEQIIANMDPKKEVGDRIPFKLLQEKVVREESLAMGKEICSFPPNSYSVSLKSSLELRQSLPELHCCLSLS